MKLSLFIAKRYLFSKKKQNAINIISVISVVGVAIGTSALVIILSVFNGIDLLLQKSADSFTPDLVISPLTGKFSHFDDSLYQVLRNNSSVAYYNQIVEEKALVKYDDKLSPVTIKGVADDYARNTHFEDNIIQGTFQLKTGDTYKSVVGYGLAAELGIGLNFLTPMVFYYPDKNAGVSASALNTAYLYPSAFFSSQQEIEGQYVLTDLEFAQRLFGINDQISKIEIKLKDSKLIPEVKKELSDFTDTTYRLEDKYELNKAFYAMMKSEKLAVFMILLFILLIPYSKPKEILSQWPAQSLDSSLGRSSVCYRKNMDCSHSATGAISSRPIRSKLFSKIFYSSCLPSYRSAIQPPISR